MSKGNVVLVILTVVGVVAASVGGYFYLWPKFRYPVQDVSCLGDNQCSPEYYCYKNPENKDMFYLGGPGKCVKGQRRLQVATPSDNPTANWKTFVNSIYSLKYPDTYQLTEDKETGGIWLESPFPPFPPAIIVSVKIENKKTGDTSETFANEARTLLEKQKNSDSYQFEISSVKNAMLAGEKAIIWSWSNGPDLSSHQETLFIIHNNNRISIDRSPITRDRDNEFDQILATFKFLD